MEQYKQEFIDFMVESDVLKFGDFTLKSGRKSPFFMNAGAYVTGSQLMKLGEYYAKAIHDKYGDDFDVLFGPAYKGIPISVVTAVAFSTLYGKEIRYCSDRKEEKDHGADKGSFLGSKLKDGDRVVMIEDVTTSGKSMEETVPKVKGAADVEIIGLMVSLNRMEKGLSSDKCALDEVKEKYGFDAHAIVTMEDVVEHLHNKPCNGKIVIDDTIKEAINIFKQIKDYKDSAKKINTCNNRIGGSSSSSTSSSAFRVQLSKSGQIQGRVEKEYLVTCNNCGQKQHITVDFGTSKSSVTKAIKCKACLNKGNITFR